MFRRLLVALVAFGLVATPWHGVALAAGQASAVEFPHARVLHQGDHNHAPPAKAHAAGQGCCHPSCTMAVVPCSPGPMQACLVSASVHGAPDLMPAPNVPSGLDRPPKFA
ncbi:hypothetical protein ACETIH_16680 [Microvirga arabica]|uniref:DUF2946 domain-containing protein n=1 Tax=Microvirga arabica TaxID=1128671 RepID=A0ABV6YAQ5_9HYPH